MPPKVLLIPPQQLTKLEKLAKNEHVSVSEIHKRIINAYQRETADYQALEQLADMLLKSNRVAARVIKEAHKVVKQTLTQLEKKRA